MAAKVWSYRFVFLLTAVILIIFVGRTLLAGAYDAPRLFDLFDSLTVLGALVVLLRASRQLRGSDWLLALSLGALVGVGMLFATLFSPYPFFGLAQSRLGQAVVRGLFTTIALLGGLAIMRQGGPVQFHAAHGDWRNAGQAILIGLLVGLPLAVVNAFALQFTQGQSIEWQNPLAALLDALQPGIVEEVIYRFALWGLLWLILRNSLPRQSVWLAGLLSMLVHNYSHFDDLFFQSPLVALGMGAVLALFWGLPPLFLAHRRGLETAVTFHWIQDVARFVAGF